MCEGSDTNQPRTTTLHIAEPKTEILRKFLKIENFLISTPSLFIVPVSLSLFTSKSASVMFFSVYETPFCLTLSYRFRSVWTRRIDRVPVRLSIVPPMSYALYISQLISLFSLQFHLMTAKTRSLSAPLAITYIKEQLSVPEKSQQLRIRSENHCDTVTKR